VVSGDPLKVFRPDIPSPARMYDYYLGGKDHYPADRRAAEEVIASMPPGLVRTAARANRDFLGRAVRHLAGPAGITQFLDIGTGLPTMGSVHEIAKGINPHSRIVYVDNDPIVIAHGREMLQGVDQAVIIQRDLREPEQILTDRRLGQILDLDRPVAVLLVAIVHFIHDDEDPADIIDRLLAPLPPGSHLVISHGTDDGHLQVDEALGVYRRSTTTLHTRRREEVGALLTGLELVDPGLVWLPQWHPDPETALQDEPERSVCYAAMARKP
jgi:SAM-dependent methyltransferase